MIVREPMKVCVELDRARQQIRELQAIESPQMAFCVLLVRPGEHAKVCNNINKVSTRAIS